MNCRTEAGFDFDSRAICRIFNFRFGEGLAFSSRLMGLPIGASSYGLLPIGIRSSEASRSSFPSSTNQGPRRWAWLPSSAPNIFSLTMVFLRIFRLHMSYSEVVDALSPIPFRQWLTFCGAFWGPLRLGEGVLTAPPSLVNAG